MDTEFYSRCTFAADGLIHEVPSIRNDTRDASLEDFGGIGGIG
jgi:hypothetical protein